MNSDLVFSHLAQTPVLLATAFSGWGITGIILGVLQAIGMFQHAAKEHEPKLKGLGFLWLVTTAVLAYYWKSKGPFDLWIVFTPYIVIGLLFGMAGQSSRDEATQKMGCGGTVNAALAWIIVYFFGGASPVVTDARPETDHFKAFWPETVLHSDQGYLTSGKFIPLRAIAKRPNPNLYTKPDSKNAGDVAGVMDAWSPYYVFANTEKSLLVAIHPNAKNSERMWALVEDCFCWTTRECINIEQPVAIYRTLEDAQAGKNPLDEKYTYTFKDHFTPTENVSKRRSFTMASLPIFANVEGKYFGFVRPEGTTGLYEMCWLVWDGENAAIEARLRASRQEFETYIVGIRTLMSDWQNAAKKADVKRTLYADGQEHIMNVKRPQGMDVTLDTIKTRNEGIPRLDGYLQRPIESELDYEDIKAKVLKMMEISSRNDLWGGDDVTFIKLSEMP